MDSQLVIVHRSLGEGVKPFFEPLGGLVWSTCLRSIAFGDLRLFRDQLSPNDQILKGLEAFEFLLEIICGLHSPVKGETEVHGQYKEFLNRAKSLAPKEFYRILHDLHVAAKRVRTAHLRNLGSQSYGSFCRRFVRQSAEANVIGSGHLAKELLPWIAKSDACVRIFCRRAAERRAEFQARFPEIEVREWMTSARITGVLIIAAPVTSSEVMKWLQLGGHDLKQIIDLRAESAEDPLPIEAISLKDVFAAIESSRAKIEVEVENARTLIRELAYANQNFSAKKRTRETPSVCSRTSA